ncbi:hybrid non-ribosomal peptide synthetase/type I polyketide synthase [Nocardia sp. NRRL S-836]|uniref:hybrid non-ribosomal peptide synthetase/type I polyketide synthase n=1 Tax=Nocardia sp. NRRL S-836 TaxID=1519492 RepID=UPI0006AF0C11|nr:hybrid non-ribosomal peptide synthetase/type I polyketide synthase [Nocardia sp. NRRL S-836]
MTTASDAHDAAPDAIAVIGTAGRFPGAGNVSEFWANLLGGADSVVTAPSGQARGLLAGAEEFDAAFFGFSPAEAERTDPQHRLFLECVWAALEDAGHGDPVRRPVTGLYAGSSLSTYLLDVLASPRHAGVDESQLLIGCDKDYLATRIAHRLDLRGPAVVVQSACSTSLVAVHLAVQALLAGECDLAVAGGVSARGDGGARAAERTDGMVSPDGRCRAFDADATGMVPGDGVGAVVLRRLDDALAAGDRISAVIRGSAINNDGSAKAGYTAPSVSGQAEVIRAAHAVGGTDPATVGYVEAHGTGTRLGDPIEVAALTDVLGNGTECLLGSVKTNIGHLDAAAGVASLIKAVEVVRNGIVPATVHFRTPNPGLGLENTRLRVADRTQPWESEVRRAGVSSFGIGGTNAHVVLDQPPAQPSGAAREWQLVPLSARTPEALAEAAHQVATALEPLSGPEFADAAFTLQTGRQEFEHRIAVVARSGAEAAAELRKAKPSSAHTPDGVTFLFSGQGAQYAGMARLREVEPVFRAEFDALADLGGLWDVLDDDELLRQTRYTQPALFAVEYALAKLWESWGVRPTAVLGHSIGELTAACVAGVMSRDDAMRLVLARGRAMGACPTGAMLAVATDDVRDLPPGVEVAARNSATQTVLTGPADAIDALAEAWAARGVRVRGLRTSHAFHSAMMDPAVGEVVQAASAITFSPPAITLISNVTGAALSTVDAEYWGRQLREPVRFADGVAAAGGPFVEIGPGRTLGELAPGARASLSGADGDHLAAMLDCAAGLWREGVPIRWEGLHHGQRRQRVSLPGYAFQRQVFTVRGESGPLRATPAVRVDEEEDLSSTEQIVAMAWERVLGVTGVDRDSSFFALGGHSLIGMQVLDELAAKFGVRLPVAALYEHPTVAGLAAAIDEARAGDRSAIRRGDPTDAPLSPMQERFWLRQRIHPGDVAANVFLAVRLRGELDTAALRRACDELTRRHAVLRARFVEVAGAPRQVLGAPGLPVRHVVTTEHALPELAETELAQPFDLAAQPPVRAVLAELGARDHALLLTLHHIATDATSNTVLLHELAALYHGAALPEPELQFADYARWLRDQDRDDEFWTGALDGLTGAVALPLDRPAGPVVRSARVLTSIPVPPEFDEYCASRGAAPFVGLLAAFQVLLSRYGAGERFVVGVPFTGRHRPELAGVVGPLFATVPIVADLAGRPAFGDLLDRVRTTSTAAFGAVAPPEPAYDVLFALQDTPDPEVGLDGLSVEPLELGNGTAQCALTVSATRTGDELDLLVDYDAARFDRTTVDALLSAYATLLRLLPEQPDVPCARLPLAERPSPASDHGTYEPVHVMVARQASLTPDALAVDGLTYARLWERARAAAAGLVAAGVRRGDVVGVCLPRSTDLAVTLLAVLTAGAAYLPLDPAHPADRRDRVVRAAGARLVLDRVPEAPSGAALAESTLPEVTADDLMYVMFTSGSTGEPKGVAVPHAGVAADLRWRHEVAGLGPGDRLLHTVSVAFDPSVWQLFGPLTCGAAVLITAATDPGEIAALIDEHDVTIADFVPTQLARLLDTGARLSSLRHVFCGGERLTADLVHRFHQRTDAVLHNQYGPTEATIDTTSHRCAPGTGVVPIGLPVAGKHVHLLDEHGEPVPTPATGELWIGGTGLAHGYTGRAGQTALSFRPDPFGAPGARMYRSGDLARRRPDGALEFAGRVDGQLKVNGVRVEPAEIEQALRRHPDVAEAAVLLREGRLVAAVTPSTVDVSALRPFLATQLPPAFLPAHYVVLDELPLTVNGKVDATRLPSVELTGRAPAPGLETEIAQVWATQLGAGEVLADVDFFQLGGDSLLAVRLVAALRERFGVSLAVGDFLAAPTVAHLAELIADTRPAATALTRRTGATAPLSWSQHRIAAQTGQRDTELELAVRVRELDETALGRALDALVARHEALRVRVEGDTQTPAEPYQVLGNAEPLSLRDGRLLAADVTPISEGHRVRLRVHRIAIDGASAHQLATDLAALYANQELPPVGLHQPDFAAWERGWLTAEVAGAAARTWLAEAGPLTEVEHSGTRKVEKFRCAPGPLAEYARRHGVSLRSLLLTAFAEAVQETVGVFPLAVPVTARTEPELSRTVGRFVNLAVLPPARLTGEFADRLAATHSRAVRAYRVQKHLPFTALEQAAGPVFPLMADLSDATPAFGPGVTAEHPAEPWTDFGLALQAHPLGDALELVLLFDPHLGEDVATTADLVRTRLAALTEEISR